MPSKKSIIEALFQNEKSVREIVAKTSFSYGYVSNIISNIRIPGILAEAQKKYWKSKRGRTKRKKYQNQHPELYRNWKKNNPQKVRMGRKKMKTSHQNATRPLAVNGGQAWTIKDIEYLEKHGQTKTIRQIAIDLGRTYAAIQTKAIIMKFDLRGNKMGANANRFRGVYK